MHLAIVQLHKKKVSFCATPHGGQVGGLGIVGVGVTGVVVGQGAVLL